MNRKWSVKGMREWMMAGKGERDESGWESPGVAMETVSYQLWLFHSFPVHPSFHHFPHPPHFPSFHSLCSSWPRALFTPLPCISRTLDSSHLTLHSLHFHPIALLFLCSPPLPLLFTVAQIKPKTPPKRSLRGWMKLKNLTGGLQLWDPKLTLSRLVTIVK